MITSKTCKIIVDFQEKNHIKKIFLYYPINAKPIALKEVSFSDKENYMQTKDFYRSQSKTPVIFIKSCKKVTFWS